MASESWLCFILKMSAWRAVVANLLFLTLSSVLSRKDNRLISLKCDGMPTLGMKSIRDLSLDCLPLPGTALRTAYYRRI